MIYRKVRPAGYRVLGEILKSTGKAMLFNYYGWSLWIPKKLIVKTLAGEYTAPLFALESAKQHAELQAEKEKLEGVVYFSDIKGNES